MSVQPIINQLNKLIELHESLLHVSNQKTELLKEGDTTALQKLLVNEQRHIQAINQIEQKRIESVSDWAREHQVKEDTLTVSTIIEEHTTGAEKEQLEQATVQLAELLLSIRRQEDLNKQLTQQSLQFVQLSLDMVQPAMKNMNYGNSKHPVSSNTTAPKRSVFDSKA
ncbi:flagellar protein FlgN [Gracilibacillus sp. S3-1-1]|uniref:Flagellar protein FlgN n=1 Tax=Gracilibacillus pellucidus TaxID=3095368 RepID=A0ACC6M121_9BACI|nr:flagellar protein FlgN [Gracilibacillus sp. S3-1-1]MDX8044596.1 flagellar protein FlgN [Gracilibacillus sp. S3-1-1]